MPTSSSAHSGKISSPSSPSSKLKGSERMSVVPVPGNKASRMARFSRYYQTPIPVCNRFLALKWDEREYNAHRKELFKSKANIDNHPPLTYVHLQLNLKKLEKEEFRLCDMENENQVLLEKMSYIYRTPPAVVTHRDIKYDVTKSSGKMRMQREFIRITAENHAILKRILTQQPKYVTKKFLLEFKLHQKLMSLNAKYPIMWDHNQMPQYVPPEVPDTRYLQTLLTPLKKRRDYRRTRPGETPIDRLGFPFPDAGQRVKMRLKGSWRRKTGCSLSSGNTQSSEVSRNLFSLESSEVSRELRDIKSSESSSSAGPRPPSMPQPPSTQSKAGEASGRMLHQLAVVPEEGPVSNL